MNLPKLLRSLLLALLLFPAAVYAQADGPVRIGYLFSDGNSPGTLAAYRKLLEDRPDLKGRVELLILTESSIADTPAEQMAAVDVLVFDIMNQQMLDQFNDRHSVDLLQSVGARGVVLGVGEGLQGEDHYRELGVTWDPLARAYWAHSGPQNQLALLRPIAGRRTSWRSCNSRSTGRVSPVSISQSLSHRSTSGTTIPTAKRGGSSPAGTNSSNGGRRTASCVPARPAWLSASSRRTTTPATWP